MQKLSGAFIRCVDCQALPGIPVPIARIEQGSGPGHTVYACHSCAFRRHQDHVLKCKACERELCEAGQEQRRAYDEAVERARVELGARTAAEADVKARAAEAAGGRAAR